MKHKMVLISIFGIIILLAVIVSMYMITAPQFGAKPDKQRMARMAANSVFIDGKFRNTHDKPVILPHSALKMLRMIFSGHPDRVPENPVPSLKPFFDDIKDENVVSIIWLGHSSVLIRINNKVVLTDPVFSKRASPVSFLGPESFVYSNPVTPDDIPFPDIILISHDHYDHLDYKTISRNYKKVKTFYVPLGVKSHLLRWGIPEKNVTELDWWSEIQYTDSLKFIAAPAQHFSGRRGQNNSTLWCSWIIKGKSKLLFFSGDSGYSTHFQEIGEKLGPFDMALIESGAYGKYWPNIHMLPEQSVQAGIDVKAKVVIPIHWGKFNLAFHPWKEPVERFVKEAEIKKLVYAIPVVGQEIFIDSVKLYNPWWR